MVATATRRPASYSPSVADKAEALLVNNATWLRMRDAADKIVAYGVPSLSIPNKYHRTNGEACDCEAGQRRQAGELLRSGELMDCCHRIAAALYIAEHRPRNPETPKPAAPAVTSDGKALVDIEAELFGSERFV